MKILIFIISMHLNANTELIKYIKYPIIYYLSHVLKVSWLSSKTCPFFLLFNGLKTENQTLILHNIKKKTYISQLFGLRSNSYTSFMENSEKRAGRVLYNMFNYELKIKRKFNCESLFFFFYQLFQCYFNYQNQSDILQYKHLYKSYQVNRESR